MAGNGNLFSGQKEDFLGKSSGANRTDSFSRVRGSLHRGGNGHHDEEVPPSRRSVRRHLRGWRNLFGNRFRRVKMQTKESTIYKKRNIQMSQEFKGI